MKKTIGSVKPYIIGVAGGSGSGKTTIVKQLIEKLGEDKVQVTHIAHDNYYKDQTNMSMEERVAVNYDHPLSLDTELLVQHLSQLLQGKAVDMPEYDFAENNRSAKTTRIHPSRVILLEGILLFESKPLRDLLHLKIFVDTEADIRLARRIKRDIAERGRTFEYSLEQYLHFTRPMHLEFVEPSRRYADLIFPEGSNEPALDVLVAKVYKELGLQK